VQFTTQKFVPGKYRAQFTTQKCIPEKLRAQFTIVSLRRAQFTFAPSFMYDRRFSCVCITTASYNNTLRPICVDVFLHVCEFRDGDGNKIRQRWYIIIIWCMHIMNIILYIIFLPLAYKLRPLYKQPHNTYKCIRYII